MAAEETLTACNTDLFPIETLGETGLGSGETLEALQSCIDPSILSIFEDISTTETKGFNAESETTLLTALTEILDNVNDENPSPFDMLPDSDLLSNQKDREQSPLKRILCLSHSLPDKDTLCSIRPSSAEKSLFKIQTNSFQRSDGEEEEDCAFTLSPDRHGPCPDSDLFGWEGLALPLPITFEQESDDGLSVRLGDLVRQMHPYCIPISVENATGEHLLPEGGILLEVVDQGENGEPILAIQNMGLPSSEPLGERTLENQDKVSDEAKDKLSDSSDHIVIVDDDDEDDVLLKNKCEIAATVTSVLQSDVKNEVVFWRQKGNKTGSSSRRKKKKKKKCKEEQQFTPVEGRVLRSGTVTKLAQKMQEVPERESIKKEKRKKVTSVSSNSPPSLLTSEEFKPCRTKMQTEDTTTASLTVRNENAAPLLSPDLVTVPSSTRPSEKNQPECSASAGSSQQHRNSPKQLTTPCVDAESSSGAPSVPPPSISSESTSAAETTPAVNAALPAPEPKPKSLSLDEYRRLRQQKKPTPVEKQDKNSTKWPTLPELPKELPPIPCLPDPNPKDPRRPNTQVAKREVVEVKPVWQPRGPGAPPTPEALLVPPAYMTSSSSKVISTAGAPKPQQTQDPSKVPEKPLTLCSEKNLATQQHATTNPTVPCVSPTSLKPANHLMSSADGKSSGVLGKKDRVDGPNQSQLVTSGDHTKICPVTKASTASGLAPSAPLKTTTISQKSAEVTASTSLTDLESKSSRPTACSVKPSAAAILLNTRCPKTQPVLIETKEKSTNQSAKDATQELIEAFAGEIGIEAADLTSLLEQFEETQVKDKQCVPEVSGRAAAVGNSRTDLVPEKTVIERLRANELSTTAALTPPATPPHQMWKPLPTASLLIKSKAAETPKHNPPKVIQIEARPLPSVRFCSKATPSAASVAPDLACMDHDYCLPNKGSSTGEPVKRWNVKQQSLITIKPLQASTTTQTPPAATASSIQPAKNPEIPVKMQSISQTGHLEKKTNDGPGECSVLETPDTSPTWQESEFSFKVRSPRRAPSRRSYLRHAASRSPRCSPETRTSRRSRKRRSYRSPSPLSSCSDSYSSRSQSRSCSPPKKRYRSRSSDSSSSSSRSSTPSSLSRSPPRRRRRCSYSPRSGSWSRSRSRSPQRQTQWKKSRRLYSPSYRPRYHHNIEESKMRKEQAIEERRVVYVGKIRESMTQKELWERFSLFGEIEECTLHFREHGDNYGFVTFYDTKDAFTAIENGSKLRKPDELPFDLCFGGRRQFCQSSYSDLDSNREYDSLPANGKFHALDFDTLLKQAQQKLKR